MAILSSKRVMTPQTMVDRYLLGRDITEPRVLQAMRSVPRHAFVPEAFRERAYADHPLPIGEEQTISQPYIVARMTEALQLQGNEKVLEIGTGSGYQTAILAELAKSVYSVDRIQSLASAARHRLEELGYHNVSVRVANGFFGWAEFAPFDRILVTACASVWSDEWSVQLAEKGRLVAPLMEEGRQKLFLYMKEAGTLKRKFLCDCEFVPLIS